MSTAPLCAVLTPRSIASIVVAALSSLFILRFGYRWPMIGGVLALGLTLALLPSPCSPP